MALNLYRRHRRKCSAGHEEDSKSGELQERRKGWKRCGCPITAAGVLNRKFDRRNTDQTAWETAKAVADSWEKAGMWDGTRVVKESSDSGVELKQAAESVATSDGTALGT
jgi:hypothetical protein